MSSQRTQWQFRSVLLWSSVLLGASVFTVVAAQPTAPASRPSSAPATAPAKVVEAENPPPDAPAPPLVTRVYDIRDLLVFPLREIDPPDLVADTLGPDRAQGSKEGVGGPEFHNIVPPRDDRDPPTRAQMVEDISRLIQEFVSADTWRDNGGQWGAVKELSGQLIITQTEANHQLVVKLLADLREARAINLRVRAHWVLADRSDVERILKPATLPGREAVAKAALMSANEKELTALPGALAHYRAETLCINSQRVSVFAIENHSAGGKVDVLVQAAGVKAHQVDNPLLAGLVLDVCPTINPDRKSVLLNIRGQWKEAALDASTGQNATYHLSASTRPSSQPSSGQEAAAKVRLPTGRRDGRVQEVRTTVFLPLNQLIFVGGSTVHAPLPAASAPATKPVSAAQLYLFVEVVSD